MRWPRLVSARSDSTPVRAAKSMSSAAHAPRNVHGTLAARPAGGPLAPGRELRVPRVRPRGTAFVGSQACESWLRHRALPPREGPKLRLNPLFIPFRILVSLRKHEAGLLF